MLPTVVLSTQALPSSAWLPSTRSPGQAKRMPLHVSGRNVVLSAAGKRRSSVAQRPGEPPEREATGKHYKGASTPCSQTSVPSLDGRETALLSVPAQLRVYKSLRSRPDLAARRLGAALGRRSASGGCNLHGGARGGRGGDRTWSRMRALPDGARGGAEERRLVLAAAL
jgi:hypothetical protein